MADVAQLKATIEWDTQKLKSSASSATSEIKRFADDTEGHAGRASKSLTDVGTSASGLGDKIKSGLAIGAGFGVLTEGVGLVKDTIGDLISEASKSQDVMKQTEAVIKSTGDASGLSSKNVEDFALNMAKVTPFSHDVIQSAENILLTFTKIGKDTMPDATEAVLNMSQALGQDTKNSAIQLGKALQDPIAGLTALHRVGVTFTDAQKEQITQMVKSGNVMGAQKLILQELNTEFGNSARAAGETYSGKLKILENQIGLVKEAIGGGLITVLIKLGDIAVPAILSLVDGIQHLSSNIGPAVEAFTKLIPPALVTGITKLADALGGKIKDGITFIGQHKEVLAAVGVALVAMAAPAVVAGITALGSALVATIASATVAAAPWLLIGTAIAAVTLGIIELVKHWGDLEKKFPLIQDWTNDVKAFGTEAKDGFDKVATAAKGLLDELSSSFSKIGQGISEFVHGDFQKGIDDIAAGFTGIDKIVGPLLSKLWDGILDTFKTGGKAVSDWIGDKAAGVASWAQSVADYWKPVTDDITPHLKDLKDAFVTGLTEIWTWISDASEGVASWAKKSAEFLTPLADLVKKPLGDAKDAIIGVFSDAWNWLSGKGGASAGGQSSGGEPPATWPQKINAFFDTFGPTLKKTFQTAVDGIKEPITAIWTWITGTDGPKSWPDKIVHFFDGLDNGIHNIWDRVRTNIKTDIGNIWTDISDTTGISSWPDKISHFFDGFDKVMGAIAQGAMDAFGAPFKDIEGVIGGFFKAAGDAINKFIDAVNGVLTGFGITNLLKKFPEWAGAVVSSVGNALGNAAGAVGNLLPGHAAGGPIMDTHWAVVGERGPEIVRLPAGSEVIPNHMLPGYAGGTSGAPSALMQLLSQGVDKIVNSTHQLKPPGGNVPLDVGAYGYERVQDAGDAYVRKQYTVAQQAEAARQAAAAAAAKTNQLPPGPSLNPASAAVTGNVPNVPGGAGGWPGDLGSQILAMAQKVKGTYLWCEKFVGDVMDAMHIPYSRQPDAYTHSQLQPLNQGTPPTGAVVFWDWVNSLGHHDGHVNFSAGNGMGFGTEPTASGTGFAPLSAHDANAKRLGWTVNPHPGNSLGQAVAGAAGAVGGAVSAAGAPTNFDMSSRAAMIASAKLMAQAFVPDLPGDIVAAIPIQESGFPGTDLGRKYHNWWSIKASSDWTGPTVDVGNVREVINGVDVYVPAKWRVYGSDSQAMGDFDRFLHDNSRYAGALGIYASSHDPVGFIKAVNQAGYATDPTWWQKVANIAGYANGGVITEPIVGVGRSGRGYMFGENGPETVTPGVHAGGNITIHLHAGAITIDAKDMKEQQDVLNLFRSLPQVARARGGS